jgi:putative phosphoesterase
MLSKVEVLLLTGDLVGYYYSPLAVLDMLRSWKYYLVRGNHEDMLKMARYDNNFLSKVDAKYGKGLRLAIEQLTDNQLDELCNLPHPLDIEIDGCKILLCHGAPWDNNYYIYPDAPKDLLKRCAQQEYDLIVLGHSHYPMSHRIGKTLIVNPGSVGQPRNGQPGAHWAIFDTVSNCLDFYNEEYDYSVLINECKQRNPDLPYLVDVLKRLN